jgi:hypothetical protein
LFEWPAARIAPRAPDLRCSTRRTDLLRGHLRARGSPPSSHSEEARETAAARERALQKAEQALERIRGGLGGRHYKTRARVDTRVARILEPAVEELIIVHTATDANGQPTIAWRRDHAAIERAAQTDGISALATNLPGRLTAGAVVRTYKQQAHVERRHRDLKQTLKVRPIFLHNDDRITALVSIVGLALLIFGLIKTELRKRLNGNGQRPGLLGEGRAARPTGRNILATFQGLGLTYTHDGVRLDRLTQPNATSSNYSKSSPTGTSKDEQPPTTAEDGVSSIAASARRVLPIPPGPDNVNNRTRGLPNSSATTGTSSSRPTNCVRRSSEAPSPNCTRIPLTIPISSAVGAHLILASRRRMCERLPQQHVRHRPGALLY